MVRNSFIRLNSYSGIHAHALTRTHTRSFVRLNISPRARACVFVIYPSKYMRVYGCKQTQTKSGHSSFNLIHSVNVCVCVCVCVHVCVFSGWKVSTVLIQLIFSQKEGRGRGKKGKIDTAARFWWLSRRETLANKWWVVRERQGEREVQSEEQCVYFMCVCVCVPFLYETLCSYNLSMVKDRGWCSVVLCKL